MLTLKSIKMKETAINCSIPPTTNLETNLLHKVLKKGLSITSTINLEKGICTQNAVLYAAAVISMMNFLGFYRFIQGNRLCDWNGIRTHTLPKRTHIHSAKLAKCLSCVVSTYLYGAFGCVFLSCHIYLFENEFTLCSCLNAKELLAWNRRDIGSLSDCNGIGAHDHLVRKQTLNHLANVTKWLSCDVIIYLYGAFNSVFLSSHIRVLEWIT